MALHIGPGARVILLKLCIRAQHRLRDDLSRSATPSAGDRDAIMRRVKRALRAAPRRHELGIVWIFAFQQ